MRLASLAAAAALALAFPLAACQTTGHVTASTLRADSAKGLSVVEASVTATAEALDQAAKVGVLKGASAAKANEILKDLSTAADAAETAYHANDLAALQANLGKLKADVAALKGLAPSAATGLKTALTALADALAVFVAANTAAAPAS